MTAAVAFSFAKGIFHPYYVSELAPFVAALVGAGVARFTRGDTLARIAGPLAIVAGVITELMVADECPGSRPADHRRPRRRRRTRHRARTARIRNLSIATALATLLMAPAAWSVQTLGHATSGTFPAGGPADAGGGFGGPGRGGPGGRRPAAAASAGGTAPGGGFAPGGPGTPRRERRSGPGGGFGGPAAAAFGGNSASLTTALDYIKAHGGGTLAVSSQSTAAAAIISSDADIAGIGGFSGRESEVSVDWFADEVADGKIRWVLGDDNGGGGLRFDGRTGRPR